MPAAASSGRATPAGAARKGPAEHAADFRGTDTAWARRWGADGNEWASIPDARDVHRWRRLDRRSAEKYLGAILKRPPPVRHDLGGFTAGWRRLKRALAPAGVCLVEVDYTVTSFIDDAGDEAREAAAAAAAARGRAGWDAILFVTSHNLYWARRQGL